MIREEDEEIEWYLNSYISRYICNSYKSILHLQIRSYKFVTTSGNIIRSNKVEIIIFYFENNSKPTLSNIAYNPMYDSKLIFLGQLWETGISYYDYTKYMVLKQTEKTIELVIWKKKIC